MKLVNGILGLLSGEFLLKWYPNSGGMVLVRSMMTALVIMLVASAANSILHNCWPCYFDPHVLLADLRDHPTWYGLVFAGVYTVLHSRFAAQWKYLADLYNALVSRSVSAPPESQQTELNKTALAIWRAAFIADAQDVHLVLKSTFSEAIVGYLRMPEVAVEFNDSVGPNAAEKLTQRIRRRTARSAHATSTLKNYLLRLRERNALLEHEVFAPWLEKEKDRVAAFVGKEKADFDAFTGIRVESHNKMLELMNEAQQLTHANCVQFEGLLAKAERTFNRFSSSK